MRKISDKTALVSFRAPDSWDKWIKEFAKKWDRPVATIYRAAVRDFIKKQDPAFVEANPIDKK
jgi:predicted transcriptional regulator